jgi:protein TonB
LNSPHDGSSRKSRWLSFKAFVSLSLALHVLALLLLYGLPVKKEGEPEGAYVIRIVKMPDIAPGLETLEELGPPAEKGAGEKAQAEEPGPPATSGARLSPLEKAREKERPPHEGVSPEMPAEGSADEAREQPSEVAGLPRMLVSPREMLLDREVIEGISKGEGPTKSDDGAITFDTSEFIYKGYLRRLKEHVEDIWVYPQAAAREKVYGDLYIIFVIRKDGTLGSVKLQRTSGYSMLDEAAMKALRDAAPFWPLPGEWDQESLTINGHFIYTLYGAYIR